MVGVGVIGWLHTVDVPISYVVLFNGFGVVMLPIVIPVTTSPRPIWLPYWINVDGELFDVFTLYVPLSPIFWLYTLTTILTGLVVVVSTPPKVLLIKKPRLNNEPQRSSIFKVIVCSL